ncbi:hypothetical protein DBR32_11705 [Taibaiella sp. KBW10]|nr:hypothetical protein DBR32_11705 [Taibaiella sp. KBW10]
MKRYLFYLILFLLGSFSKISAQDNYTDFSVNGKFGLVKVPQLEEYLKPIYTGKVIFTDDYLGFKKGKELFFYQKTSGKQLQFLVGEDEYRMYRWGGELLHVVKDGKSALLGRNMKLVKTFPYLYITIRYPYWSSSLIAKSKNGYDIYDVVQSYKLIQSISASDYFSSGLRQEDHTFSNCTIFYGKDQVMVYNDQFQLLKTVPGKVASIDAVIEILRPYFMIESDDPSAMDPSSSYDRNWSSGQIENGYKICESPYHYPDIQLKVKERFNVRNGEYSDVTISSKESSETYTFKLDKGTKKALIPLKYQQLMGLEVLQK